MKLKKRLFARIPHFWVFMLLFVSMPVLAVALSSSQDKRGQAACGCFPEDQYVCQGTWFHPTCNPNYTCMGTMSCPDAQPTKPLKKCDKKGNDQCCPGETICQKDGKGKNGYQCICVAGLLPSPRVSDPGGNYVWQCNIYNPDACKPATYSNPKGKLRDSCKWDPLTKKKPIDAYKSTKNGRCIAREDGKSFSAALFTCPNVFTAKKPNGCDENRKDFYNVTEACFEPRFCGSQQIDVTPGDCTFSVVDKKSCAPTPTLKKAKKTPTPPMTLVTITPTPTIYPTLTLTPTATLTPSPTPTPTVTPTPMPICKVVFEETDKLYCREDAHKVAIRGRIVNVPPESTLQKAWRIVLPADKRTQTVYSSEPAIPGMEFTVEADWPGVRPNDTAVEIHAGLNVLDKYGRPYSEFDCTASVDYYWYPGRCQVLGTSQNGNEAEIEDSNSSNEEIVEIIEEEEVVEELGWWDRFLLWFSGIF